MHDKFIYRVQALLYIDNESSDIKGFCTLTSCALNTSLGSLLNSRS